MWECKGLAYSDPENLVSGEEVEQPSQPTIRQLWVCCMELKLCLFHLLVGVRTGIAGGTFLWSNKDLWTFKGPVDES